MNIRELQAAFPSLLKHNIVPFIWGAQGIGKTSVVREYCKRNNLGFVHLHLATQEVGDLVGLLKHCDDGTVEHARPEWFPTTGSGIVFLDEFNRAHPDVLQTMFPFTQSKTIHRHKLPDGWKVVAAGNYQNENFTVTDTSDAALMSRFCHIDLRPTVEEFVTFAEANNAMSVAGFIMDQPKMLETDVKSGFEGAKPDRRAWLTMVAPLEDETLDEAVRFELYCGIVGGTAAAAFKVWKHSNVRRVRLSEVMNDYSKVRPRILEYTKDKETRFDMITSPLEELYGKLKENPNFLTDSNVQNLKGFFYDLPLEVVSQAAKSLNKINFAKKDAFLNDPTFINALLKKTKAA